MSGAPSHNLDRVQVVDDDTLVARAQVDPNAFDAIFERYWNPVLRYCYYRLGNWHRAEDAAAQVFLNALSALPGFTGGGHENAFKAWLFTIAFRIVANVHRADTRHPQASIDTASEHESTDTPPDELTIAAEEQHTLFLLIEQLKPEQRQLIELRLAGLTDVEIAQVLGKNPAAIRKAQSRAVFAMREMLAERNQESRGGRDD